MTGSIKHGIKSLPGIAAPVHQFLCHMIGIAKEREQERFLGVPDQFADCLRIPDIETVSSRCLPVVSYSMISSRYRDFSWSSRRSTSGFCSRLRLTVSRSGAGPGHRNRYTQYSLLPR